MGEWIHYTLFTLAGDRPVLLIDVVTSALGLTCVVLAGRGSKYNFWVGYLYTAALFLMFWSKSLYANLLLQPISLSINILGHYRWTHPRVHEQSAADSASLKVSMLTVPERLIVTGSVFAVAFLWGWVLDSLFPGDPHPYLDSCVTVLILVAQLLSAMKKWECWIAWLLVNLTQMALYLSVGYLFMPIVSGLYLLNGLWSLRTWLHLYQKGR